MDMKELYAVYQQYPSVVTDTRNIRPNDLFFALKGPNFNGNHYAKQALEAGASFCIVDEDPGINDPRIIRVNDTLLTLQYLAKTHRQQFDIPFIAITGSNGKTTTKELIHAVLSTTFNTYTTTGNLNNHIGVPLTILKIKKDANMAVIEMGANHQLEIKSYCEYAMPTHGLITNCGKAHLEGFGGEEGVRKGKGELFDYLRAHQGTAFIYSDYDYLGEMSKGIEHISKYGTSPQDAELTGKVTSDRDFLQVTITKGADINLIKTQLVGGYNLPNVLAAVAIGKYFQVPDEKIKSSLENYVPSNSRSQLIEKNGHKIILDAYNANPTSMKAAIENFSRMEGSNKILMLGSMMELGNESSKEHHQIVELIGQYPWKNVVLVGDGFKHIHGRYHYSNNAEEAGKWFHEQVVEPSSILIKGSRSMQMEKILD